jgi:hypothetical protein
MKLSEQFALRDLDDHAISSITAEYLFDREHGSGFNKMRVKNARLHEDKMYVHYRTDPTYERVATAINLDGSQRTAREYDTIFEFQAAAEHLGDPATFLEMNPTERAAVVRDYIDHGLVKVWCSCPAYFFQSHWEDMDSHDSSVFPFPGPKGKGIWHARHADGLLQPGISMCKHIAACIHEIDNDVQTISNALANRMKQMGR